MIVKLLTEHHLEFLSLKGGCRGSLESTCVKMSNCWKSHAGAHMSFKCLPSRLVLEKVLICILLNALFNFIQCYCVVGFVA